MKKKRKRTPTLVGPQDGVPPVPEGTPGQPQKETPRRGFWRTLVMFFALFGPGIITSNVDNDAGGITTYSLAGSEYGLSLLWTLIPITLALIVIQEMCARMGVVSGKGLSDLIRSVSAPGPPST